MTLFHFLSGFAGKSAINKYPVNNFLRIFVVFEECYLYVKRMQEY